MMHCSVYASELLEQNILFFYNKFCLRRSFDDLYFCVELFVEWALGISYVGQPSPMHAMFPK